MDRSREDTMMYKAKGKNGEGWREGHYWKTDDTTYCFEDDYQKSPGNTKHYILFDQMTDWGMPNRKLKIDILPETLCRYTEKTDINHKRIWENDIIVYEDAVGIIRYGEYYSKHLGFYIEWLGKHRDYRQDILYWIPKIKVIGNSFDNPEVIENANNT